MRLRKVETKNLQSRVYERLKEALIAGSFKPGQVLKIRDLAEQLGTSPMPVRQSLHRLVSEHALVEDDRVRSSVRVPTLSRDVFEDLRSVRCLIEGEAAARAAANAGKHLIDELNRLRPTVEKRIAQASFAQAILANRIFYFTVYQASDSRILLKIIESLWLQSGPYVRALLEQWPKDQMKSHLAAGSLEIIEALKAKDEAAARDVRVRDINNAAELFLSLAGDQLE